MHPLFDEEHFKQMTSEKIVTEYQRGFPVRKWKKIYCNEVLDCRVYATAALNDEGSSEESLSEKLG
jgi:phage terminase large subunit GpA-like protein